MSDKPGSAADGGILMERDRLRKTAPQQQQDKTQEQKKEETNK